jgi:DNA polymerase-4/DNA polymerase V
MENKREWILHIDGDSFFASCEVSRRPDLFGKPVVVGEERGIATALTYPAKALGLKRGDPVYMIKRDYPQVAILSSHFELYRKFAYNLMYLLLPHVSKFEAYSIDECFCEIIGTEKEIRDLVTKLKKEVQSKLGITYSFGVSITKTLSKIASKLNKPNGLVFLMNQKEIDQALRDTAVESIWGVGFATDKKVKRYNIRTAYDFINCDIYNVLGNSFNKTARQTFEELRGIKHFDVGESNPHKKSIQSTRTFLQKTFDNKILKGELSRNVEVACSEMRKDNLVTNKFYIFMLPKQKGQKVVEMIFELPNYTCSESLILKHIERLFDKDFNNDRVLYKKTGVVMLNLLSKDELKPDLFGVQENINEQEIKIGKLIDGLRHKYGFSVISLASSLEQNNRRYEDYKKRHVHDIYESGLPYPFLGIIH